MAFCESALFPLKQMAAQRETLMVERQPVRARSSSIPRRNLHRNTVEGTESIGMMSTSSSKDSLPAFGSPKLHHYSLPRERSNDSATTNGTSRMGRSCTEQDWQDNTKNCNLCAVKLGKRYFKRRHHCRICGQCVCSACSPSFIFVAGERRMQRTCHECVAGIPKVPALKKRMALLADKLQGCGSGGGGRFPTENCGNLEQAVSICEHAIDTYSSSRKETEIKVTKVRSQ